jgi:polygalacturonase
VRATGNYSNGIYVLDCDDGLITACTTNDNDGTDGSDGVLVQNSRNVRVEACRASRNGEDGIDVGGFEEHVGRDSSGIEIVDCVADGNPDDGFAISGTNGTQFQTHDVTVTGCRSHDNGGAGIQVYQKAFNIMLGDCQFVDNKRGLNFHSAAHDIQVIRCEITRNTAQNLSIDASVLNLTMEDNTVE